MEIDSLGSLSAEELAWLTHYLITHETQPGGPYAFGSHNDKAINSHVRKLLDDFNNPPRPSPQKKAPEWNRLFQSLTRKFGTTATTTLRPLFYKVSATDANGEISKLSQYFSDSLPKHLQQSSQTLRWYSEANQCAWVAYSIYDQALDAAHTTDLLPIAHYLTRQSIQLYRHAQLSPMIETLFTRLDLANTNEVAARQHVLVDTANNTISFKKQLDTQALKTATADRSIIHILGPMLISGAALGSDKRTLRRVEQALSEYCYARQLLDDIHDWKHDIEAGQPTYVTACLLETCELPTGTYRLDTTLADFERRLFDSMLIEMLDMVDQSLKLSTNNLQSFGIDETSAFTRNIIGPLMDASKKARIQHTRNRTFVTAYTQLLANN